MNVLSAESVTEGHPDKVADRISDSVLDAVLQQDPYGRVACETLVTANEVVVAGEVSFRGSIDVKRIVRDSLIAVGYTDERKAFNHNCKVRVLLNEQSRDISIGVDKLGAGDQGNMFGYATNETANFMPKALNLVHSLARGLWRLREKFPHLGPDGKAQISFSDEVHTIVASIQHDESVGLEDLRNIVEAEVVDSIIHKYDKLFINPTGRFVKGGPEADTGLTGRKIIIDSYGPFCRHGGGAFSGKDATKVDRAAAYAARWIAKNVVAAGLAKECEVQISYVIGVAEPTSIHVDSRGTGLISDEEIKHLIEGKFDLRPNEIIERLELRRPIYAQLSSYGHFGREGMSWERLDMVSSLRG